MSLQPFNPSANESTQYKVKASKLVTPTTLCAPLWVQIQQDKEIFLFSKTSRPALGPQNLLFNAYQGFPP